MPAAIFEDTYEANEAKWQKNYKRLLYALVLIKILGKRPIEMIADDYDI